MPSRLCRFAGALFAALGILSAAGVIAGVQEPETESQLAGRLATVEPAARRLTMIPDGEADLVEVFVADEGEVRQQDETLSLSDLVIQVGKRITVRYRLVNNRRVALSIIVESA